MLPRWPQAPGGSTSHRRPRSAGWAARNFLQTGGSAQSSQGGRWPCPPSPVSPARPTPSSLTPLCPPLPPTFTHPVQPAQGATVNTTRQGPLNHRQLSSHSCGLEVRDQGVSRVGVSVACRRRVVLSCVQLLTSLCVCCLSVCILFSQGPQSDWIGLNLS